jgi:hypothetical protein
LIPRTAPDHCNTDELTRLCRVPLEKRSLRTAREALLRTAPALEGPRLIDLGSGEKLKEILRDRQAFHSFEDHLRMSMEKTQFHKRVQTAHSTVEEMIHTAHANPAGLKRGRTSPAARRLAVRCELARAHFEARDLRCGHISSHLRAPPLRRNHHRSTDSDSCRTTCRRIKAHLNLGFRDKSCRHVT